jgi:hypothetical protein
MRSDCQRAILARRREGRKPKNGTADALQRYLITAAWEICGFETSHEDEKKARDLREAAHRAHVR